MRRNCWFALGVLGLVLGVAASFGYQSAPTADAAQHQESETFAATAPQASNTQEAQQGKAWLGVLMTTANGTVRIQNVVPNSPAASAGLKRGDIITAANGSAVSSPGQLVDLLNAMKPGDTVSLSIQRNSSEQTVTATLGTQDTTPRAMPRPQVRPAVPNPLGSLHGILPDLRDVPADQRFDHFRGGSFSLTDKDGKPVTINITAGTVTAVSTDTISLKPNSGGDTISYNIGKNTSILPGSRAKITESIKVTDKLMVVSRQGSDEALVVYRSGNLGGHPSRPDTVKPAPNNSNFRFLHPELSDRLRGIFEDLQQRLRDRQQARERAVQPAL